MGRGCPARHDIEIEFRVQELSYLQELNQKVTQFMEKGTLARIA